MRSLEVGAGSVEAEKKVMTFSWQTETHFTRLLRNAEC